MNDFLSGKVLVRKATDARINKTENPLPGHTRSTPSTIGPNKPAAAAAPAVLKFASPKKRADRSPGTRSAIGAQLPPANAAEPRDIRPPNKKIWPALFAQTNNSALTALRIDPAIMSGTRPMWSASHPVRGEARMVTSASAANRVPACSAACASESPRRSATKKSRKRPVT
jgi:hypothetical protein